MFQGCSAGVPGCAGCVPGFTDTRLFALYFHHTSCKATKVCLFADISKLSRAFLIISHDCIYF